MIHLQSSAMFSKGYSADALQYIHNFLEKIEVIEKQIATL